MTVADSNREELERLFVGMGVKSDGDDWVDCDAESARWIVDLILANRDLVLRALGGRSYHSSDVGGALVWVFPKEGD